MESDANLGGGTSGGTGDLGSSAGGMGAGGTGGSTGGSGLSGAGTGGSTGGSGLGGTGTGGSTSPGYTEGGGYTTGDDFGAHEHTYRRHYSAGTQSVGTTVPPSFEEARAGYELGHRAAENPAYAGSEFGDIEVELEKESGGRLANVRSYARHAFEWKKVLGALALAGGAWWVSRKLSQAVSGMGEEEEMDCRTYYDTHPARETVPYEQARTVYVIGWAASRNPEYTGRSWDEVEPHVRSGFTGARAASYDSLRDFGRRGYERGTSASATAGSTETAYTGTGGTETGYTGTGGTAGTGPGGTGTPGAM